MKESKDLEFSSSDRSLSYNKSRSFVFKNAGSINIEQDITLVGGTVWDASIVLAQYLDSTRHFVAGKRFIEIGAGTALPSIVATRLGAASVLATDQESIIQITQQSIRSNSKCDYSNASVRPLDWNNFKAQDLLHSSSFDVVLGADILYNSDSWVGIQQTLLNIIRAQDHRCIVATTTILLSVEQRRNDVTPFFTQLRQLLGVENILLKDEEASIVYSHVHGGVEWCVYSISIESTR